MSSRLRATFASPVPAALLASALLASPARAFADVPPPPQPTPTPTPAPAPPAEPEVTQPHVERTPDRDDGEPSGRELSAAYYKGFRWGLSPGVMFSSSGDAAFSLSLYLGYGFDTGSVILVPGVAPTAVFSKNTLLYMTPELRIVYPLGIFAPFITGGAGPGVLLSPSKAALAVRAGGGFTLHPSMKFAIGIEAGYAAFVGLPGSGGPYIGPILSFAF